MTLLPVEPRDVLHIGPPRPHRRIAVTVGALLDALDVTTDDRPLILLAGPSAAYLRWRVPDRDENRR